MAIILRSDRFEEAVDEAFRNIASSKKITFTESRVLFLTVSFLTTIFEYNSAKGGYDLNQTDLTSFVSMKNHLTFVANASKEVDDLVDLVFTEVFKPLKDDVVPREFSKLVICNINHDANIDIIDSMVDGAIKGLEKITEFVN